MAIRTTSEDVEVVLTTNLSDASIDAFIEAASAVIDECVSAQQSFADLGATTLEIIEKFLTAHIIKVTEERLAKREKIGEAEVEYAGEILGKGLESTGYGQVVLMLDKTGTLKGTGKRSATVRAITTRPILEWGQTLTLDF